MTPLRVYYDASMVARKGLIRRPQHLHLPCLLALMHSYYHLYLENSKILGRDNMPKHNIHLLMTLYIPHEHPVNDHAYPNPMQVRNHCPSMTFASSY